MSWLTGAFDLLPLVIWETGCLFAFKNKRTLYYTIDFLEIWKLQMNKESLLDWLKEKFNGETASKFESK